MRRAIAKHLEDPLAVRILRGEFSEGDDVLVEPDSPSGFRFQSRITSYNVCYTKLLRIIQEDEALARRFRVVKIEEPTLDETREILFGLKPRLETNYGVEIRDEAIERALSMSDRYARSLRLPDKIINWIDTACVRVEIRGGDKVVLGKDILEVISDETRTPVA